MSRSSLILLVLMILASICFNIVFCDEDDDSCDEGFERLKDQRNITMCKSLRTLGAQFAWRQNMTTNSTVVLEVLFGAVFNEPTEGWLAWGVNPERAEMIGTKAIIGVVRANGSHKVATYEVTKETRMGCHLLPSPLEGVKVLEVGYNSSSGFYSIYAKLVLNTSVYNMSRLHHVWQVGYKLHPQSDDPGNHPITLRNVDSTETVNLTSGVGRSIRQNRGLLRSVHGALNIAGWGTFLPIGVIVARYLRVYPCRNKSWYFLHVACQSLGYILGTTGWALGLWLGQASRYYTFQTHRIFAIFIFTFTTIQMLALRLRPKESDEYRKYWNMYHHFLGYALLVTIFINIFKGISILQGGDAWKWAYVGILSSLGAITLGFELYTWGKFIYEKREQKRREIETNAIGGGGGNPAPHEDVGGGKP